MKLAAYFWDLKTSELARVRHALSHPDDAHFTQRMTTFLSRCDRPKEVFSVLPRESFIEAWPQVRSYWMKRARHSPQRDWWETLYEQLVETHTAQIKGKPAAAFKTLGNTIKEKRVERGLSQKQLAERTQLSQPVISQIEEGKKNITLFTLIRLCKILNIASLDLTGIEHAQPL